MAKKQKTVYVCQECGYESAKWLGKCPACKSWSTMVEEIDQSETASSNPLGDISSQAQPQRIKSVKAEDHARVKTDSDEFNRVLGGGVVPGSLVLIGGDPGVGKSTLLLQVSAALDQAGKNVLYVTGEESASQVKMRADRLDVDADFYIYPETNLDNIKEAIKKLDVDHVVIDSIQTMNHPLVESATGSVSQVRESTSELMKIAKMNQIAIFIVGHVTKQGAIAGPRILEHMVDTVLYFEGDANNTFRILRAVKNRFGSTNEIGVFEMQEGGLVEILNPSELFLEERLPDANGSAVVVSMEGTRPILAEIQSLITPTVFGNARRTASGLDYNRVSLIMAVLEKRGNLLLQNFDAYLKASGGMRLDEPAIDLAIAISIASSYKEQGTRSTDCFMGDLGLTGEIRRISRVDQRVNEAAKLGFKRAFIPANNLKNFEHPKNIEVIGVETIQDCLYKVFNM